MRNRTGSYRVYLINFVTGEIGWKDRASLRKAGRRLNGSHVGRIDYYYFCCVGNQQAVLSRPRDAAQATRSMSDRASQGKALWS